MTSRVNPDDFSMVKEEKHGKVGNLNELSNELKTSLQRIGLMIDDGESAGTFVQQDQTVSFCSQKTPDIEVMNITNALDKYDWLEEYNWKAVKADTDAFTLDAASQKSSKGYFIRSLPGKKVKAPVQTCLYVEGSKSKQVVHNIIIAEENSEMNVVTGCAAHSKIDRALHEGISEFYVKKGARITFTMIHEWQETIDVRPRSAIILEEGATFINNYILLKPVSSIQSNPIAYLNGDNARVMFQTIVYGKGDSKLDLGSRAVLKGRKSSAEMISRVITKDDSDVIVRGLIVGEGEGCKGHLECRGLILSDTSRIDSIPELDARNPNVDITHEAAVGKISQEEINYLMMRGASEDEATSMIINGFLSFDFSELPPEIAEETLKLVDQTMDAS